MSETATLDYGALTRRQIEAAVWAPTAAEERSDFDLTPEARRTIPRDQSLRPAAVLCPIVERDGELRVVLTRRADHLKKHAGQIAFPGGKVDLSDKSPFAAALREAEEEIGLLPPMVDVLGAIDPYQTSTGFRITPFVGFVHSAFHPIADEGEVAEVFEAPLGFLMDPANRNTGSRRWRGGDRRFYEIPWQGRHIWGATAGMLKNLSDRLRAAAAAERGFHEVV